LDNLNGSDNEYLLEEEIDNIENENIRSILAIMLSFDINNKRYTNGIINELKFI
jgi:hypothetical protein